jgi:hypothetical protein
MKLLGIRRFIFARIARELGKSARRPVLQG